MKTCKEIARKADTMCDRSPLSELSGGAMKRIVFSVAGLLVVAVEARLVAVVPLEDQAWLELLDKSNPREAGSDAAVAATAP
jgi:hypothetical protein